MPNTTRGGPGRLSASLVTETAAVDLLDRYEVDETTLRWELETFVNDLKTRNLLVDD